SSLTHLKAIPALTEVSLTQDFDDTVFKYLGQIPNLKRLRVASQFLTGEFLADCSWPLLASLQLTNSRKTLSANLWNSLASMPELAELELCTVKPLTGLDKDCSAKLKGLSFLV